MSTPYDEVLAGLMDIGLSRPEAERAARKTRGRPIEEALDWHFSHANDPDGRQSPSIDVHAPHSVPKQQLHPQSLPQEGQQEDDDVSKAIEASLRDVKKQKIDPSYIDPQNPHKLVRNAALPPGLKNTGNSCYFSSLCQLYFWLQPFFAREILEWKADTTKCSPRNKFLTELQRVFALLLASERRFIDPTSAVQALAQLDRSDGVLGEQQDIVEYHARILDAIESCSLQGIVRGLFFGSMQQCIEVMADETGEVKRPSNDDSESFATLIVDVGAGDLINGLDLLTETTLGEDYNPGFPVRGRATKTVWLERIPPVVCFQVQRVDFDTERKIAVKRHTRFAYPDKLSLDRYCIEWKDEIIALRKVRCELRENLAKLVHQLDTFRNFEKRGFSLDEALLATASYLESYDTATNSDATIAHLRERANTATEECRKLENDIEDLERQIATLFDRLGGNGSLERPKHILTGILVHDGDEARQGHYWAYIRPLHALDRWFKFDDISVSEATREQVDQDSLGGHLDRSAYFLVYVHSEYIAQAALATDRSSLFASTLSLDPSLESFVYADNADLQKKIRSWNKTTLDAKLQQSTPGVLEKWKSMQDALIQKHSDPEEDIIVAYLESAERFALATGSINEFRVILLHRAVRDTVDAIYQAIHAETSSRGLDLSTIPNSEHVVLSAALESMKKQGDTLATKHGWTPVFRLFLDTSQVDVQGVQLSYEELCCSAEILVHVWAALSSNNLSYDAVDARVSVLLLTQQNRFCLYALSEFHRMPEQRSVLQPLIDVWTRVAILAAAEFLKYVINDVNQKVLAHQASKMILWSIRSYCAKHTEEESALLLSNVLTELKNEQVRYALMQEDGIDEDLRDTIICCIAAAERFDGEPELPDSCSDVFSQQSLEAVLDPFERVSFTISYDKDSTSIEMSNHSTEAPAKTLSTAFVYWRKEVVGRCEQYLLRLQNS